MVKRIFVILKKILMSALLIYAYDSFCVSISTTIPINIFNIFVVSFLGIPAMIALIVFSFTF